MSPQHARATLDSPSCEHGNRFTQKSLCCRLSRQANLGTQDLLLALTAASMGNELLAMACASWGDSLLPEGFDVSQAAVPFGTLLEEDGESNTSDIFLSKG